MDFQETLAAHGAETSDASQAGDGDKTQEKVETAGNNSPGD